VVSILPHTALETNHLTNFPTHRSECEVKSRIHNIITNTGHHENKDKLIYSWNNQNVIQ